ELRRPSSFSWLFPLGRSRRSPASEAPRSRPPPRGSPSQPDTASEPANFDRIASHQAGFHPTLVWEAPMRRVFVGVSVLAVLAVAGFGVSRMAPAQPKVPEVLIGSVLPLTGNFASLGQQYLWASQTVEDIVNNDYPDLQVPLGPGKGVPGLGG